MVQQKYGTRIETAFNGSQKDVIDALFEMASATIQTNKLFEGFRIDLDRSPLGEWRFSIVSKEKA